ncbi:HelD family protein [Deinococcus navajonensis]|uniref:DNA 3'-5' helicase n=1 Tax=Deinococcus navajonensis TaxID=309884 RepID=A0ABV8XTI4_9DEIO
MTHSRHPEHETEALRLDRAVEAMEAALRHHAEHWFEAGATPFSNRVLNRGLRADLLETLETHRDKPYFGRLDFRDHLGQSRSVYFGYAHLEVPHGTVLDWRCDLYTLFVSGTARKQSYRVRHTGATHTVELSLKRRLDIQARTLRSITDDVDWRETPVSGPPAVPAQKASETFLINRLAERGDPRLQTIVETLQVDQDAIIRAPAAGLRLVHGVAGSGKTSIAYHRLAYLLYQDHSERRRAEDALVIGPNRLFLGYVRDLLPDLGVRGVVQNTFGDWVWRRMAETNRTLRGPEMVVHGPPLSGVNGRLKGQLRFGTLLERYAARLEQQLDFPAHPLSFPITADGHEERLVLTPFEVRTLHRLALQGGNGTDARRERFLDLGRDHVRKWFRGVFSIRPDTEGALSSLTRSVTARLSRVWPRPDLVRAYTGVFAMEVLQRHGTDLYSADELTGLAAGAPGSATGEDGLSRTVLEPADHAGLHVLNRALYGETPGRYTHIVVDEAQDLAPLELAQLLMSSRPLSMTLVGDTAQSIHAHGGVDDWSELTAQLPADQVHLHVVRRNYRSTREIVGFCNGVLRAVQGPRAVLSEPVDRSGSSPVVRRVSTTAELVGAVRESVLKLQSAGLRNIAVITRTPAAALELAEALNRRQVACRLLEDPDGDVAMKAITGVLVIPAALAKGLEFEGVVVHDASEAAYPGGDARVGALLFVAVSRALHALHVLYVGAPSAFLGDVTGASSQRT